MTSSMRITGILLKNYRQFRNFNLDLTDPVTKEPLDKVCFIGSNGTGKSTLLALLAEFLKTGNHRFNYSKDRDLDQLIGYQIHQNDAQFFVIFDVHHYHLLNKIDPRPLPPYVLSQNVCDTPEWKQIWDPEIDHANDRALQAFLKENDLAQEKSGIIANYRLKQSGHDLAIYALPDGSSLIKNSDSGLPSTNLDKALKLFESLPPYHEVSYDKLNDFWDVLIYQIKKRERNYLQFLESPNAQDLQVSQAKMQFDVDNPEILELLAEQWNIILEQADLEFDIGNAKIPVQLNENLEAYIRLKSSKMNIPYNLLSTGIRNFIFRFGHIFTLYFSRQIENGFLLIDEPEVSLFPDLLHDIIARYESIIENTQFFAATHSPIVAAQFRAEERFILEFDETGAVNWRHGVSPEGDDPNDLLMNDFAIRSLYREKGNEEYKKYLTLRQKILATEDKEEKLALIDEYAKIGNAYNFPANDAIPEKVG